MRSVLVPFPPPASSGEPGILRGLGRLAGGLVLALSCWLMAGTGQAWAAAAIPQVNGALVFSAPNYRGVIGGPPGIRVTVQGSFWLPYSQVALSVSDQKSCSGAVPVGTYPTNGSGGFTARFNWPTAANHVTAYYACGTQANKGTFASKNTFNVLASEPASLSFSPAGVLAGDLLTVNGRNWLPAPQTVNILIVPCSTPCQVQPAAHLQVVTDDDGRFSQQVAISAGAASGGYYIQATNSTATLSAIAGPFQVTGQGTLNGTPSPDVNPTTLPGTTVLPPSTTQAAIKDALIAGVLGLLALLGLIGLVAFFVTRSRGSEGPAPAVTSAREGVEQASFEDYLQESGLVGRRIKSRLLERVDAPPTIGALPPGRQNTMPPEADTADDDLPTGALTASETYPWAASGGGASPSWPANQSVSQGTLPSASQGAAQPDASQPLEGPPAHPSAGGEPGIQPPRQRGRSVRLPFTPREDDRAGQ